MTEKNDILKQTKQALSSSLNGVYIFVGKEEYLKRSFLNDIKNTLFADELSLGLDLSVFDGEDCAADVSDALDSPPAVSQRRLAVWYNSGGGSDKSREKSFFSVLESAKKGVDTLLIVYFYADQFDTSDNASRSRLARLASFGTVFDFAPFTEARLAKWVVRHFASHGFTVGERENAFLCERTCCDMTVLASEIEKICCYMDETGEKTVSVGLIERLVPCRQEFGSFYLAGRIGERDCDGILKYFSAQYSAGVDPIQLLALFTSEVERLARLKFGAVESLPPEVIAKNAGMHEYAVKLKLISLRNYKAEELEELLHVCYETDLAMKSTAGDKYVMLQALACRVN